MLFLIFILFDVLFCSVLLFADEANAFLCKRATVSSAAVPYAWWWCPVFLIIYLWVMIFALREWSSEDFDGTLSAFLYCTGSKATHWCFIGALFTVYTVGHEKVTAVTKKVTKWVMTGPLMPTWMGFQTFLKNGLAVLDKFALAP